MTGMDSFFSALIAALQDSLIQVIVDFVVELFTSFLPA